MICHDIETYPKTEWMWVKVISASNIGSHITEVVLSIFYSSWMDATDDTFSTWFITLSARSLWYFWSGDRRGRRYPSPSTLPRHPSSWEERMERTLHQFSSQHSGSHKNALSVTECAYYSHSVRQRNEDEDMPLHLHRGQQWGESHSIHDNQEWPRVKTIHIALTVAQSALWTKWPPPYPQKEDNIDFGGELPYISLWYLHSTH